MSDMLRSHIRTAFQVTWQESPGYDAVSDKVSRQLVNNVFMEVTRQAPRVAVADLGGVLDD
jgi:hypothetical protein